MMPKRVLGTVLLESGRITQEEVDRALEHQRTHGGYFGQAVVDLGILRREEIDWALASQFDLPFIFPDADAADRNATRLVSPDWALAHLAVPIVHGGPSITVVVADPLDHDTLEDLRARTGLDVEMALASASRIRELIRAVYGASEPAQTEERTPLRLADFLTAALAQGADRIGVSVRGTSALGWYTVHEARERQPLEDGWDDALEAILQPSPFAAARAGEGGVGGVTSFEGTLRHGGADLAVDAQVMTSLSGTELLLRPRRPTAAPASAGALPDPVRSDLRLLAAAGNARVAVTGDAPAVERVLPQLPSLVLGDDVRAAHLNRQGDVPGVYTLRVDTDVDVVGVLESYEFDALTVDLPLDDARLAAILAAAPIAFARAPGDADPRALGRAGINWILSVSGDQDDLAWELRSTNR